MTVLFYIPGAYVVGVIHRRLVGPLQERFLMPLFDKKDKSRYATFTRRSLGLGGGMTAVFAVLAGRLYQLQIRDGDQYMTEAEDNRINERLLAPPRGRILDRFGVELANNRRNYRVLLVAEQATDGVEQALDTIGKVIALTDAQKKRVLRDHGAEQEIRARAGGGKSDLGGIRPHQSASALSARRAARCRRDPRLSLRRRAGAHPGLCRRGVAGRQEA